MKLKLQNTVLSALVPIAFAFFLSLGPAQAATLRLGVTADALSRDPIASSDNPSIWTQLLLFDQLVRPSKDGGKEEGRERETSSSTQFSIDESRQNAQPARPNLGSAGDARLRPNRRLSESAAPACRTRARPLW